PPSIVSGLCKSNATQSFVRLSLQLCNHRVGLLKLQAARCRWTRWTAFGAPAVVDFQRSHDLVLALTRLDETYKSTAHRLEACLELHDIGFGRNGAVSRNDRIEIERKRTLESFAPLEKAATLRVIDIDVHARRPRLSRRAGGWRSLSEKQIAGMNDAEFRKVDDGVTVRVTAPEMLGANFLAAKKYRGLIGERDPRQSDGRPRRVLVI